MSSEQACRSIDATEIDRLIGVLRDDGYTVVGPTLRDGVIVQDEIRRARELPSGWTDRQEAGTYRVERRDDGAMFGFVVGPHSPKARLHPSRLKLFEARRAADGSVDVVAAPAERPAHAFLGLRGCELAAIAVQDRVYLSPGHADADYAARRADCLLVAVDCGEPASTCFCTSMGGDPEARGRYDLALTELVPSGGEGDEEGDGEGHGHRFLVRTGSAAGDRLLAALEHRAAAPEELARAARRAERARASIVRTIDTSGLRERLVGAAEHPHWDDVAARCLGCTNCTAVCPTCFCSSVEEVSDLGGERAERWRRDDSCFDLDFSHVHGGSVRVSTRSRYRQWLTHKLAHWIDQFGTSGCVGCGRCITWCPVGIDLTEEVRALGGPADAEDAS